MKELKITILWYGYIIRDQYGTFRFRQYCVAMATEARCHGNVDFLPKTSNFHFSRLQYFRKVQICGLWYGNLEGWYLLLIEKNHWDLVNFNGNETANIFAKIIK